LRTWRALRGSGYSHFDAGVRETATAQAYGAPTVAQRRAFCEKNVVVSYRDAGAVDVDDAPLELKAKLGASATLDEAADVFANVVSALLTPLVDEAVAMLKKDEHSCLAPLADVANLASTAATLYEKLGLPVLAAKPVVYEGKASRSQLCSLFAKYAAAAVAKDLDATTGKPVEPGYLEKNLDVANVDVLQVIFGIADKRAAKLTEQVVKQLLASMMGDAGTPFGGGGSSSASSELADLLADPKNVPSDAEIDNQLDELQRALDSGALSDAERADIRATFQTMLGTADFDAALKAAEDNKDSLDPRSRKALDLLRRLL